VDDGAHELAGVLDVPEADDMSRLVHEQLPSGAVAVRGREAGVQPGPRVDDHVRLGDAGGGGAVGGVRGARWVPA
jgi:hypothetical protein